MTRFIIHLEVSGDASDALEAVDAALDAGGLQDAVNGYHADEDEDEDEERVAVTSAYIVYGAQPQGETP